MNESTLLSVCLGLGLAAACGFRVFVPFLIVNLAARAGWVELGSGFDWMVSTPALIAFGVATLLEIGAYHIPWLDNLLDSAAGPIAVVAGVVVSASVFTGIDPFLKWSLALIAGGSLAASAQGATTLLRGISTFTTGGLANPLIATAEAGFSFFLAVLSIVLPALALALTLLVLFFVLRTVRRRRAALAVS